ncbi:hypothetical protein ACFLXY_06590 [Chloroflexota bacterium]
MKEYDCVGVDNFKKVAKKIQEYLVKGWHLHTYQAVSRGNLSGEVLHYLLFEKE